MTVSILRSAGAVVAALIVALVLVVAVELVGAAVHPPPEDFDGTPEAMHAYVANYPGWILAFVVLIWGGTTFLSTWLATRLGTNRHPAHGLAVGLFLFAAVLFNMSKLPYPIWFEVLNLVAFPIGIYFGVKLGRGPRVRME